MPSRWLPVAAAGLVVGLLLLVARGGVRGAGDGGVSLLEERLHMYAVDARAMKRYLSHTQGSQALLHGGGGDGGAQGGGPRRESIDSFVGAEGGRDSAVRRIQAKQQHEQWAAGKKRIELFLDSSSLPARATSLSVRRPSRVPGRMRVVPRDESQMLSEGSQLMATAPGGRHLDEEEGLAGPSGGAGSTVLASRGRAGASLAGGPPCAGPVRHTDSPDCVAKKAMAQAIQAERDAQSVDESIARHKNDNSKFDRWEGKTHSALSHEMDEGFSKLKKMLRRNGRRVNSQDRQIMVGDEMSLGKTSKFAMREAKDMAQVEQRISRMEQQARIISKMRGPPGPPGPRGPSGYQGVRGPQGERGPMGDMGEMGETGLRGHNGFAGNNGHRGPAGHFLDIKGKLGKQSTAVDQRRLKKFADSLRVMEQMVHRMGALRKPPTPNPRP